MLRHCLLLASLVATAAAQAAASAPCPARAPCHATAPEAALPTADELALRQAAADLDEARFIALLQHAPAAASRGVLPLLLQPASSRTPGQGRPEPEAHAAEHRRTLPLRQRLLEAALKHGASAGEVSDDEPLPPLHLAIAHGSPQLVDLLLTHGADPNQQDMREGRSPLEFLLDERDWRAPARLPPYVSRAERGAMVERLVQAGAARPYQHADEEFRKSGNKRPIADYLAWNPLVALTEGARPIQALLRTGTRPAIDPADSRQPTPLAVAAGTGNAEALPALAGLLPETVTYTESPRSPVSLRLDAALAAMAAGHWNIARPLLRSGLPWQQVGPRVGEYRGLGDAIGNYRPGTALHFAVRKGDAALASQLLAWGASAQGAPKGAPDSPVGEAVEAGHDAIALMLAGAGADSLARTPAASAPLDRALEKGSFELASGLLKALGNRRRSEFADEAGSLLSTLTRAAAAGHWTDDQEAALQRLFDQAGMDARRISAHTVTTLIVHGRHAKVLTLVKAGARTHHAQADQFRVSSPLLAALESPAAAALVPELLRRGASVNERDADGRLLMQRVLESGRTDAAELLVKHGARLDFPDAGQGGALDAAIASGDAKVVDFVLQRTGKALGAACIAAPAAAEALATRPGLGTELAARGLRLDRGCGSKTPLLHAMTTVLLNKNNATADTSWWQAAGASAAMDRPMATTGLPPLQTALAANRSDVAQALLRAGAPVLSSGNPAASPAWLAVALRDPALLRQLAEAAPQIWQQRMPVGGLTLAEHLHCRESRALDLTPPPLAGRSCRKGPASTPADTAAAAQLAGTYRLSGQREVGGELRLRSDGRFGFGMAYGGVDEQAQGRWWVHRREVLLLADPPGLPDWVLGSTSTEPDPDLEPDSPPMALMVKVVSPEQGQVWSNMELTAEFSNGRSRSGKTGRGGRLGFLARQDEDWPGAQVRRIGVAYAPSDQPIRWFDVPDGAQALTLHFKPGALNPPAFGALVLDADPKGQSLTLRHPAAEGQALRFTR